MLMTTCSQKTTK